MVIQFFIVTVSSAIYGMHTWGLTDMGVALHHPRHNPTSGLGSELVHLQGLVGGRIGHAFPRGYGHEAVELRGWEGGGGGGRRMEGGG